MNVFQVIISSKGTDEVTFTHPPLHCFCLLSEGKGRGGLVLLTHSKLLTVTFFQCWEYLKKFLKRPSCVMNQGSGLFFHNNDMISFHK